MRKILRKIVDRLAPVVSEDHPDFKGDHPAPIILCPPEHGAHCKCTWY